MSHWRRMLFVPLLISSPFSFVFGKEIDIYWWKKHEKDILNLVEDYYNKEVFQRGINVDDGDRNEQSEDRLKMFSKYIARVGEEYENLQEQASGHAGKLKAKPLFIHKAKPDFFNPLKHPEIFHKKRISRTNFLERAYNFIDEIFYKKYIELLDQASQ